MHCAGSHASAWVRIEVRSGGHAGDQQPGNCLLLTLMACSTDRIHRPVDSHRASGVVMNIHGCTHQGDPMDTDLHIPQPSALIKNCTSRRGGGCMRSLLSR